MRDEIGAPPPTTSNDATPQAAGFMSGLWGWLLRRYEASGIARVVGEAQLAGRRVSASAAVRRWLQAFASWRARPGSGWLTLLIGGALITALAVLSRQVFPLPSLGAVYIPLIAMLAYYWGLPTGLAGVAVQLLSIYWLLIPTSPLPPQQRGQTAVELLVLAAVSLYVLALVQLAHNRRAAAERGVERLAKLNAVGTALAGELQEEHLLRLIARTACDLTGAGFAAFTLRPVDALGQPLAPAEGSHFHLAAVVGVTPEQEALFRRAPLGGEGLLAPIFRYGVTVRVADALGMTHTSRPGDGSSGHGESPHVAAHESPRDVARQQALSYAHGGVSVEQLRAVGAPRGHPIVRSFLGAPLLDHEGKVRGGLLLGHTEPDRFSLDDEKVLKALAAQAAVALENARLYHNAQSQALELNAVFESITDAVIVYDAHGGLLHQNHAALAIRGLLDHLPADDDIHTTIQRLVDAGIHGAPAHQLPLRAAIALTDAHAETRDYVVSASPLLAEALAEATGGALPDAAQAPGTLGGVVLTWHEVTETRKLLAERQAHTEAETRRALLQQVIDEQPGAVYLVRGRDARLELANRAAQSAWGATWREGQSMADFLTKSGTQFLGPGGRPLGAEELATIRTVRDGESVRHYEEVIRRPDGATLPVLLNTVALDPQMLAATSLDGSGSEANAETGSGAEPAALVVLQDVTAIKEAERLKDEFIAIAAHELKTPMAAVKGYADMLTRQSRRDGATLESWQVEALDTIDQATNRLVELTEDLLDVARLQAERLQLSLEPHDLIALARRTIKRFQALSDKHTLSLATDEEYVVAVLDVRRTEQIIGNLLSNAIKYSPDGGVVTVTIEQDNASGLAQLAVCDHGIGIPASQQSSIFNRFARADNARERGIAGTGLGLYLCRELAELQGGRLWFESEEGRGSIFWLTLPLAKQADD